MKSNKRLFIEKWIDEYAEAGYAKIEQELSLAIEKDDALIWRKSLIAFAEWVMEYSSDRHIVRRAKNVLNNSKPPLK